MNGNSAIVYHLARLLLLFGVECIPVNATQLIYVSQNANGTETNGQSWDSAFRTVQSAVTNAAAGDEIWVAAGTYFGSFVLKDGVALYGGFSGTETNRAERDWNLHRTILDGQGSNNVVIEAANASSATRLDGVTIQNGRANYGAGIYCSGGSVVLANNTIISNSSSGYLGGGGILSDAILPLSPQSPLAFFTNVAGRLLESHGLRMDNIPIYPTNCYNAEICRTLQVAANLVDATTNRGTTYPFYPSVFRPVFTNDGGNILISGFVEAENADFVTNRWLDLASAADRAALVDDFVRSNANVFGLPIVVGVKKGLPNFNEYSLQTDVFVARRLEAVKPGPSSPDVTYRQSYELGISNSFGVEAWNSYTQAFPRPLELRVTNYFDAKLVDNGYDPPLVIASNESVIGVVTNLNSTNLWNGLELSVPLSGQVVLVPVSALFSSPPFLRPPTNTDTYDSTPGFPVPDLTLLITNKLEYVLIDQQSGRILDFVNFDGLAGGMEINRFLAGPTNLPASGETAGMFWLTNWDASTAMTFGITNQIYVSTSDVLSDGDWLDYSITQVSGQQKEKAIDDFRKFLGLPPLFNPSDTNRQPDTTMQVPFTPARRLHQTLSWQVNDPLVHYRLDDLFDAAYTGLDNVQILLPYQNLPASNLGQLNRRYSPWGGSPGIIPNLTSFDASIKDPAIRRSDDWSFPVESTVNLDWLDHIHRGTPWQTIYFGSAAETTTNWMSWSGSAASHPTNDWNLINLFLNGGLGLDVVMTNSGLPLLINNTIAANSATGIGGAIWISPGSMPTLMNNIVAYNSGGILKQGTEPVTARANCIYGNTSFDYYGLLPGSGDLSADPQFVGMESGNFDLFSTSPCIDRGDDSVFPFGWLSDEPARHQGLHIDIGAYELSPLSPAVITGLVSDFSGGQVSFTVKGFAGQRYAIDTATNLSDWIPVSTNSTGNGSFLFNALLEPGLNQRFYRARLVP